MDLNPDTLLQVVGVSVWVQGLLWGWQATKRPLFVKSLSALLDSALEILDTFKGSHRVGMT